MSSNSFSGKPSARRNTHIVAGPACTFISSSFLSLCFGPEITLVIYVRELTPPVAGNSECVCLEILQYHSSGKLKKQRNLTTDLFTGSARLMIYFVKSTISSFITTGVCITSRVARDHDVLEIAERLDAIGSYERSRNEDK